MMEVEYTPTVEDIIALHRQQAKRTKGRRVVGVITSIWLLIWLAILGCLGVLAGPPVQPQTWFALTALALVMVSLALFVFRHPIMAAQLRRRARHGEFDRAFIPQKIILTPDGVTCSSEDGVSFTLWKAIERIPASEKHVFIYLSRTTAYVIPKRAFADKEAPERFIETARQYRQAALA